MAAMASDEEFYCRYYVGHKGQFGHEFMEFELKQDGTVRYANNSAYKNDSMIRKQCKVSPAVMEEIRRIVRESKVVTYDDSKWPEPDNVGKQELEVVDGDTHIAFACRKIGSLLDIQKSDDPEGLQVLYFLVQDLKCLIFSLISMHFKIKPIP